MQQLQLIFDRVAVTKKKIKDIRTAYKDALAASLEYQDLVKNLKISREKKKQIENTVKQQFVAELTKLADMQIDLASDLEMISDITLVHLMKGEKVEVKDRYENTYEPILKIKFKKN